MSTRWDDPGRTVEFRPAWLLAMVIGAGMWVLIITTVLAVAHR